VQLPDLRPAEDERVPLIRADPIDALPEIDPVQAVSVSLVVLEPDEGQGPNVHRLAHSVRLHDR
jgi:hypothetical protein